MNISDVNATTHRSDQLRNSGVGHPGRIGEGSTSEHSADEAADRVEISNEARTAEARKSRDLDFARKALRSLSDVSDERLAAIKDRIAQGYYNRQDVVDHIAERLSSDLERGA